MITCWNERSVLNSGLQLLHGECWRDIQGVSPLETFDEDLHDRKLVDAQSLPSPHIASYFVVKEAQRAQFESTAMQHMMSYTNDSHWYGWKPTETDQRAVSTNSGDIV